MKPTLLSGFRAAFAAVLATVCILPFLYVLLRSFQTAEGITFLAYYDVFLGYSQYLDRFWLSLGLCLCICLGQATLSVLSGFAFAKYKFPGRDLLFFLLMILMILPVQVTLVPNYIVMGRFHLLNTYAALILPSVFAPLGTFILRQSFSSIPDSLLDAAALDGCGLWKILTRIAVPMNAGGIVCVLLLSFLDGWNMVEQPIAYLKTFQQYPISVALAYVPPTDKTLHLVCCVLVTLPPLFLFALFHKELVEGIVLAQEK